MLTKKFRKYRQNSTNIITVCGILLQQLPKTRPLKNWPVIVVLHSLNIFDKWGCERKKEGERKSTKRSRSVTIEKKHKRPRPGSFSCKCLRSSLRIGGCVIVLSAAIPSLCQILLPDPFVVRANTRTQHDQKHNLSREGKRDWRRIASETQS